ncbi:hypothetical protein PHMEG_00017942 [Phytophthora megakarya]|uniref:Uncharacterized protein n=1 Tax=Phytophthora megakarya TaxID=4795 RepID=A0A225VWT7_9STRA|nr:hypothetical protein PHMEG_00017942 [Phytophthora megakarya]
MDEDQYVLALKDGLTHYCELVACDSALSTLRRWLTGGSGFASLRCIPRQSITSRGFSGLHRPSPFKPIMVEMRCKPVLLYHHTPLPCERLERLRTSVPVIHRAVVDQREQRRLQNMRQSTGSLCNFSVVYFVLWSRIDHRLAVNKLVARYVGPFEVVEARSHLFVIRN